MNPNQKTRLANILNWLTTAKECLPATSDGTIAAQSVAEASALVDRMYRLASSLASLNAASTHDPSDRVALATYIEVSRRAA